jgi:hypothetical protein
MKIVKPVEISAHGFAWCRWGVAVLVWLTLILNNPFPLAVGTVILIFSALLKVRNAPLIWLHRVTLGRLVPSAAVVVDEYSMAFAHTLGSVLAMMCLLAWFIAPAPIPWIATALLGIAKLAGALGYCSGVKLYQCLHSDTCCTFLRNPHA